MNHLNPHFKDITNTQWSESQISLYNRKIDTYNYAVAHQNDYHAMRAREEISNCYHAFCSASVAVRG